MSRTLSGICKAHKITPEGIGAALKVEELGAANTAAKGLTALEEAENVAKTGAAANIGKTAEPVGQPTAAPIKNALDSRWTKFSIEELKKMGQQSLQYDIRALHGTANDAFDFFKAQVKSFAECKPGVYVGNDEYGIIFVYRAVSKSGPPTIDINGIKGLRKIKFLNNQGS